MKIICLKIYDEILAKILFQLAGLRGFNIHIFVVVKLTKPKRLKVAMFAHYHAIKDRLDLIAVVNTSDLFLNASKLIDPKSFQDESGNFIQSSRSQFLLVEKYTGILEIANAE